MTDKKLTGYLWRSSSLQGTSTSNNTWPRHPIALAEEALSIEQLAPYTGSAHFRGTWERAGFDHSEGYSDALLDELMVYGSEAEVAVIVASDEDDGQPLRVALGAI